MTGFSQAVLRVATGALLAVATIAGANAQPRAPQPADGPSMVETAPLRCWWRTSKGAVAIGEPFDVRLTCAVLETDTVQVVPDESRLTVAGVQLTPFEVIGGDHPADTRAGQRRFFQYRYTVRVLDPNQLGQDVALPRLSILYKVQSRTDTNATLEGRDFAYLMPGLTVHVLSQVTEDVADIRDGTDVGLERLEALRFRARLLDIGALTLLAGGVVLLVAAVGRAVMSRSGTATSNVRPRIADRRVLGAVDREMTRIARDAAAGWTGELVRDAHAALRIVGAIALGRGVSERPLEPAASPGDGRVAVRAWRPGRVGASVSSATTPADLRSALDTLPASASPADRQGLEALRDALSSLTAAQFAEGGTPDALAMSTALEAGRSEAARLTRDRRWQWLRRRSPPRAWRQEGARP
jgi:hypothetical protein